MVSHIYDVRISMSFLTLRIVFDGFLDHCESRLVVSVGLRSDCGIRVASAPRVSTDTMLTDILRAANPGAAVVATRDYNMAIFGFPNVTITPLTKDEIHSHIFFAVPARRGQPGGLTQNIQFGAFAVKWGSETFLMYTAQVSCTALSVPHIYLRLRTD